MFGWSRWLANCPMPYLFLLLLFVVNLALADPENFEEQPKRGNTALLSRYGRALLSRYGKRSVNPPPYAPEDHLSAGNFDEGEWLLCQKGLNELLRCLPFSSKH